ncbi:MAG: hypothetical protein ACREJ2_15375 [Planctomycetota bacterium]
MTTSICRMCVAGGVVLIYAMVVPVPQLVSECPWNEHLQDTLRAPFVWIALVAALVLIGLLYAPVSRLRRVTLQLAFLLLGLTAFPGFTLFLSATQIEKESFSSWSIDRAAQDLQYGFAAVALLLDLLPCWLLLRHEKEVAAAEAARRPPSDPAEFEATAGWDAAKRVPPDAR